MRYLIAFVICIFSISSQADSADEGLISDVYADASGKIAIKLKDGFPNASSECASYNGWVGSHSASPVLISTLLAAKATYSAVTVVYSGCTSDGHWANLTAVYTK